MNEHKKFDGNGEVISNNRELVNRLISLLIENQDNLPHELLEKMVKQFEVILGKNS